MTSYNYVGVAINITFILMVAFYIYRMKTLSKKNYRLQLELDEAICQRDIYRDMVSKRDSRAKMNKKYSDEPSAQEIAEVYRSLGYNKEAS